MTIQPVITFDETLTSPINTLAKQTYLPACKGRFHLVSRAATLSLLTLQNFGKVYEKGAFTIIRFTALLIKSLTLSTLCKSAELSFVLLTATKTADYALHTLGAPILFGIGMVSPKKLISLHQHLECPQLFKEAENCRKELEADLLLFNEKKYCLDRNTLEKKDFLTELTLFLNLLEKKKNRYQNKRKFFLPEHCHLSKSVSIGKLFEQLTSLVEEMTERKMVEENSLKYTQSAKDAVHYTLEKGVELDAEQLEKFQKQMDEAKKFGEQYEEVMKWNHHDIDQFQKVIKKGRLHVTRGFSTLTEKDKIKNGFITYQRQMRAFQDEFGSVHEESKAIEALKTSRFFTHYEIVKEIADYYTCHEGYLKTLPEFSLEKERILNLKKIFREILENKRRTLELKIRKFYTKYAHQPPSVLDPKEVESHKNFFKGAEYFLNRSKDHFRDLANNPTKHRKYLSLLSRLNTWLHSEESLEDYDISFLPVIEHFRSF